MSSSIVIVIAALAAMVAASLVVRDSERSTAARVLAGVISLAIGVTTIVWQVIRLLEILPAS